MSEWHCSINNTQYGPVSKEQMLAWITEGRISSSDLAWREGMTEWQPVSSIAELAGDSPLGPVGPPRVTQRVRLTPHRGTTVLVLGILGLLVCFILGIIAWVMGNNDLRQMKAGRMDPSGLGSTRAGRICGMISTIMAIVGIGLWILMIAVAIGGR